MIELRDICRADMDDYFRWFLRDREWQDWDGPWEEEDYTEASVRELIEKRIAAAEAKKAEDLRSSFEIICDGEHIGWVSSYTDLGYLDNPGEIPAVGIDICSVKNRNKGSGTQALRQFMEYFRRKGFRKLYIQTWSGNLRMIHTALKLGFREFYRVKDLRLVRGAYYDAVTFLYQLPLLEKAQEQDIEVLTKISADAFNSDREADGSPCGGPPDYDSSDWHREMLQKDALYRFCTEEKTVGGAVLLIREDQVFIERVFIDPAEHRRGYGYLLMVQIEEMFPEAGAFLLDTPLTNIRTNRLYQKCGYTETARTEDTVSYRKSFQPKL